jgi:methyl acetate hydrolase
MTLQDEFNRAVEGGKLPAVGAVALDASGNVLFDGAAGKVSSDGAAYTTKSPMLIFSCTKLVTSIAALQLLEQGKLKLDDLVETYVPRINDIQVLDGFDDGKPILRAPKTKPTLLNLFTHTAGFSYDFFDKDTLQWRLAVGQNPSEYVAVSSKKDYQTPFRHDPGEDFTYGVNTDYLGFVVEAISGERLDAYIAKHIIRPLGLKQTGLFDNDLLVLHMKDGDGNLTPSPLVYPTNAEVIAGGHYLTSTLHEYAQILLAVINHGTHPNGVKLLEAKTVDAYLFKDYIPQVCSNSNVGQISTSIPQISNVGEMLPGVSKGWSCGLMLNNDDVPGGRAKGSGAWAGLGNLFYWLDVQSGKLGIIGTAVLPFMDPEVLRLFDRLEKTVYEKDGPPNYKVTLAM